MPTWPAELPPPAINTLNEAPPDNTISSNPDKGPPMTRRRTTANVRPISFAMYLTPAQTQILDDFYDTDTYSGSISFDYTHPRTGAAVKAKFAEKPSYAEREGILYNAAVSLNIQP